MDYMRGVNPGRLKEESAMYPGPGNFGGSHSGDRFRLR